MDTSTFLLQPISSAAADALRFRGGQIHVADENPGYPCRQCLQDAAVGDELILVSHDPFEHDSPYRSASPIFLHRVPCEPPQSSVAIPAQLTRRQLSVRAFDRAESMIDATVTSGDDLGRIVDEFLEDGRAERIHVHNAERGCWAVTIVRNPGDSSTFPRCPPNSPDTTQPPSRS